ncbi:MAG: hypothetical protein WC668_04015 [Patescibacteria group bacterium]|jgi:hypothetical protein
MKNHTSEAKDEQGTLGQLLREKVKAGKQAREAKEQEEQRKRLEPFISRANDLIKELPRILAERADEGATSHNFQFIILRDLLKDEISRLGDERHQPPIDQRIIDLFRNAYLTRFVPTAGKLLGDFCKDNDLEYDDTLQETLGQISVIISWK